MVTISESALRYLFFWVVSLYSCTTAWYQIAWHIGVPSLLLKLFLTLNDLPKYLSGPFWSDLWDIVYMGYCLSGIPLIATFAFLTYLDYQGLFLNPEPVTVYIPLLNGTFLTLSDTKSSMEVAVGLPIEWKHFYSFMGWNIIDQNDQKKSVEEKSVEEPVEEKSVEEPVEEKSVEEPVEEKSVEESIQEKSEEKSVEQADEKPEEKSIDEPVEEKFVEQAEEKSEEKSVEEPVEEGERYVITYYESIAEPIEESITEPIEESITDHIEEMIAEPKEATE